MPETEVKELSEREREILRLVARGASNKQIAHELFISANTVKVHLRNIFAKIGANSRTEAAMYAVNAGLVETAVAHQGGGSEPGDENAPQEAMISSQAGEAAASTGNRKYLLSISLAVLIIGLLGLASFLALRNNQLALLASASPPEPTPPARVQINRHMPTARQGLAVTAYEDLIFAIGGETAGGVTGVVESYDISTNTWITLSKKPTPVSDTGAAVIGGRIFVPGGRLDSGELTAALEIYDPRQDSWQLGSPLPVAVSAYAMVAFEGKLYLFGGWDGKKFLASVYEYDPEQDQWNQRTPMPTARGFSGAAVAGGKIFVLGGYNGEQTLALNEIYLPNRDEAQEGSWSQETSWTEGTAMPEGRQGMGVTSMADIIYVVGGEGESSAALGSLEYTLHSNEWQEVGFLIEESWSRLGVVPWGTNLYIIGGQQGGVPTSQNLAYQVMYTILFPVIK